MVKVLSHLSYLPQFSYSNGMLNNKCIHQTLQFYTSFYRDFNEGVKILSYIYDKLIYCNKVITILVTIFTHLFYNRFYIIFLY